jgi:hypothetical protein
MGTNHAMELAAFVALRLSSVVLGLTSAELAEVLDCLGHDIFEQFHLDPPQLLPCCLCQSPIVGIAGQLAPSDHVKRKD